MNRDILNRILCGYDRHFKSAPHSHSVPVYTQLLLCGKERDVFQASHNLAPNLKKLEGILQVAPVYQILGLSLYGAI